MKSLILHVSGCCNPGEATCTERRMLFIGVCFRQPGLYCMRLSQNSAIFGVQLKILLLKHDRNGRPLVQRILKGRNEVRHRRRHLVAQETRDQRFFCVLHGRTEGRRKGPAAKECRAMIFSSLLPAYAPLSVSFTCRQYRCSLQAAQIMLPSL